MGECLSEKSEHMDTALRFKHVYQASALVPGNYPNTFLLSPLAAIIGKHSTNTPQIKDLGVNN